MEKTNSLIELVREKAMNWTQGLPSIELDALKIWDPEVRAFMSAVGRFRCEGIELVDFTGRLSDCRSPLPEINPSGITVATNGFGDWWVADVNPNSGQWGAIFYISHDPPVFFIQHGTYEQFLRDALLNPEFDRDTDALSARISLNPDRGMEWAAAMASGDRSLCDFAGSVNQGARIHDLRGRYCQAVDWGSGNPVLKRHQFEHIFAAEPRHRVRWRKN